MSNLYELCCCPNLARQNHRVLTFLPHSLSSTAASPLSDSYREVGNFGIIAVPFDLGIISLYMRYRTIETSAAAPQSGRGAPPHSARPYEPYVYCKYEYLVLQRYCRDTAEILLPGCQTGICFQAASRARGRPRRHQGAWHAVRGLSSRTATRCGLQ